MTRAGEVLVIPLNIPALGLALEDTLDVNVFSPPRKESAKQNRRLLASRNPDRGRGNHAARTLLGNGTEDGSGQGALEPQHSKARRARSGEFLALKRLLASIDD